LQICHDRPSEFDFFLRPGKKRQYKYYEQTGAKKARLTGKGLSHRVAVVARKITFFLQGLESTTRLWAEMDATGFSGKLKSLREVNRDGAGIEFHLVVIEHGITERN
jgi:hypothetical protein